MIQVNDVNWIFRIRIEWEGIEEFEEFLKSKGYWEYIYDQWDDYGWTNYDFIDLTSQAKESIKSWKEEGAEDEENCGK